MSKTFDCLRRIVEKQHELSQLYLELGQIAGGAVMVLREDPAPVVGPPIQRTVQQIIAQRRKPSGQVDRTDEDDLNPEDLADHADSEPEDSTMPPFYVWLISQRNKLTSLAEVAGLIADDERFPVDATISEQREYLKSAGYSVKLRRQFGVLVANYLRKQKSGACRLRRKG